MTKETGREAPPPWQRSLFGRLSRQSPPSALLLRGPEGIGKRRLAMALSRHWLVDSDPEAGAIFDGGNHPDFLLVEPEQEDRKAAPVIKIDQIRATLPFCMHSPALAPRRIAVVYPACLLNRSAANAFLKLLEEPPPTAILMLVAHDASRLPATVRSRCQLIDAPVPTPEQSREWLREADKELSAAAMQMYSRAPFKFAAAGDIARLEKLAAFLSEPERTPAGEMAGLLADGTSKVTPAEWMDWILKWATDLAATSSGVAPSYFVDSKDELKRIAARAGKDRWLKLQEMLAELNSLAPANPNAQLFAERALDSYLLACSGK